MWRTPSIAACALVLAAPLAAQGTLAGRWQLVMERPGWTPAEVRGSLVLTPGETDWSGRITFAVILWGARHELTDLEVGPRKASFRVSGEGYDLSFAGELADGGLAGTCEWQGAGEFEWTAKRQRPELKFEPDSPKEPARWDGRGLDSTALDELISVAGASQTDALVVLKDGELVCERTFDRRRGPIEAMSATKSLVGLAVGLLVDDGTIESVDEPVHTWYPEWREGKKREVTLRHLLTHTSGLQAKPTTEDIYASEDFVRFALDSDVTTDPGTQFRYNNKATNLISGIVEEASGKKLHELLGERLFEPLGIEDWSWTRDRAGNPHGMSGCQIRSIDLAKIGQLLLQRGEWEGERILSEAWIDAASRPAEIDGAPMEPTHGLLFWLTPSWTKAYVDDELFEAWGNAGAEPEFLDKVLPLVGLRYGDETTSGKDAFHRAVMEAFAESEGDLGPISDDHPAIRALYGNTRTLGQPVHRTEVGPILAYSARGYLGQWLVVVPEHGLVGVRQRRYSRDDSMAANFNSFESMLRGLVD